VSASAWAAHLFTSSAPFVLPWLRRSALRSETVVRLFSISGSAKRSAPRLLPVLPLALVIASPALISESRHGPAQQAPRSSGALPQSFVYPRPSTWRALAVVTIDHRTDGHQHGALKVSLPAEAADPLFRQFFGAPQAQQRPSQRPERVAWGKRCEFFLRRRSVLPMPHVVEKERPRFCWASKMTSGGAWLVGLDR